MKATAIFVAASWRRIQEARFVALALAAAGHAIVSRWHAEENGDEYFNDVVKSGRGSLTVMEDVRACDVLVEITGDGVATASHGGRFCEFGGALFIGKRVMILGPREHAHHFHPSVRAATSIAQLLAILDGGRKPASTGGVR